MVVIVFLVLEKDLFDVSDDMQIFIFGILVSAAWLLGFKNLIAFCVQDILLQFQSQRLILNDYVGSIVFIWWREDIWIQINSL